MRLDQHYTLEPSARVLLADLGLSPGNVLRRAGLRADVLSGGPAVLAPQEYFALWRALAAEADDPELPIRIGEAVSFEAFAPPIFAAMCSPNLAVAADRIARYKALVGPLRLIVTTTDDGLDLELRWPPHHDPPAVLTTTELAWWVALARLGTRSRVVPVSVTSPAPPEAPQALASWLGTPVAHGDRHAVTFAAGDAARPFLTANERMWEFFEPELRRGLLDLEAAATTGDRVRASLLELLPSGRGTIAAVAAELGVSARTLQRQLQQEGTSFQDELRSTRQHLAHRYLREDSMEIVDIAFLLGYDEPNSFARAYHAWTGHTPHGARAAALAADGEQR